MLFSYNYYIHSTNAIVDAIKFSYLVLSFFYLFSSFIVSRVKCLYDLGKMSS